MRKGFREGLFLRRLPLLSAVVLLSLWSLGSGVGVPSARGQQIDPSDLWYTAFVRMKEGEAKEREQKALAAYNKFIESKRLFDAVARDHPDFHPSIVRYRRKELGDKIAGFKAFFQNGGAASGALPGMAGETGVTTGQVPNQVAAESKRAPVIPQIPQQNQRPIQTSPAGAAKQGLPSWDPEFANSPSSGKARLNSSNPLNSMQRPQTLPNPPRAQPPAGTSSLGEATRQIQQQFDQMEEKIRKVEAENKSLKRSVFEGEERLQKLQGKMAEAQKREQDLRQRYQLLEKESSTAQNAEAQVVILKKQLSEALDALENVNKQNREILVELEQSRAQLASLQNERDQLKVSRDELEREHKGLEQERDELAEIVENGGDGTKAIARLTKINAKLREDLTEARVYAESLAKVDGDKRVEVEMLKEKIAEIAEGRLELIAENARHEKYIAELQQGLKLTAKGLVETDEASPSEVSPEALEENRLLRGVVLRQLRRQAQIKQARQMILSQLDELGVESEALLESLDVISVTPGLTEDEKKLFRQPQVAELIQGSGGVSLHGTILIEGSKKNDSREQQVVSLQDLTEELEQLQKVGQFDFMQGRYQGAARAYRKFLSYSPQNVEGICNLASVQMKLKEYDEAEKLLKKSLTLEKKNGRVYYLLGVVYFEQGKMDDALKRFDEGLQLDPKNAKALNCVGVISSQKGWVEKAEKSFTKAVAIDPDCADAHFNLSILYTMGKKPNIKKGEKHYRKAVQLGLPRDAKIEQVLNS